MDGTSVRVAPDTYLAYEKHAILKRIVQFNLHRHLHRSAYLDDVPRMQET